MAVKFEPMDPGHLDNSDGIIRWKEGVGAIVPHIDVEKVQNPGIHVGVFIVIGENHYVQLLTLVDLVLILKHIICGILELEGLVLVDSI